MTAASNVPPPTPQESEDRKHTTANSTAYKTKANQVLGFDAVEVCAGWL